MDLTARKQPSRAAHRPALAPAAKADGHRRYRCSYTPRDALGHLNPSDTGAAPSVQFCAANAEQALDLAQKVTGCPVIEATRIEG
ncbi:hypothetical protein QTI51_17435 [Variovorax sp. J22G73]|uniref:hypothetical protein n=1 Tax=unclassified Variovorax TaxID=663243 RepID=UPI002575E66D|nr:MULTISPECIES: hypothetical protein [unclassified Variovorax]MDM0007175.1 hypothetical protein [Variovorax sp. J22R203]MDM0099073.1 hypothetical protein [Variovorax sp. J22G73]